MAAQRRLGVYEGLCLLACQGIWAAWGACRAEQQEAERRQREERQRHLEQLRAVKRTQEQAQASCTHRGHHDTNCTHGELMHLLLSGTWPVLMVSTCQLW